MHMPSGQDAKERKANDGNIYIAEEHQVGVFQIPGQSGAGLRIQRNRVMR